MIFTSCSLDLQIDIYLLTYLLYTGREQAAITGERLGQTNISYSEIIHSTMDRAVETARIIHKYLPSATIRADEMLVEGGPVPPIPTITYWHLPTKVGDSILAPRFLTSNIHTSTSHWRSQDFVFRGGAENRGARVRDAEGIERGGEWGGGIFLPSRLGCLGSVVSSPSGVPVRGPKTDFGAF